MGLHAMKDRSTHTRHMAVAAAAEHRREGLLFWLRPIGKTDQMPRQYHRPNAWCGHWHVTDNIYEHSSACCAKPNTRRSRPRNLIKWAESNKRHTNKARGSRSGTLDVWTVSPSRATQWMLAVSFAGRACSPNTTFVPAAEGTCQANTKRVSFPRCAPCA